MLLQEFARGFISRHEHAEISFLTAQLLRICVERVSVWRAREYVCEGWAPIVEEMNFYEHEACFQVLLLLASFTMETVLRDPSFGISALSSELVLISLMAVLPRRSQYPLKCILVLWHEAHA